MFLSHNLTNFTDILMNKTHIHSCGSVVRMF